MYFDVYDVLYVALKTLAAAVYLFILARLMGKKQIGQLTVYDYIVGIAIGSVAGTFSVDESIGVWQGIVSLLIWALFPILLALISQKSYRARRLLDGPPSLLMFEGQFVEKNMRSSRMNVNDLLAELRIAGVFDPAEVEIAIFERDGRVSILKKSNKLPLTPQDMGQSPQKNGLCVNLVIDGKMIAEHLALIGRDESWLRDELGKQGCTDVKAVLLAAVDVHSNLTVYRKGLDVDDPCLM